MALWPNLPYKHTQTNIFPGVGVDKFHTPLGMGQNLASEMQDFSSRRSPELTTRKGREAYLGPINMGEVRRIHFTPDGTPYIVVEQIAGNNSYWYRWDGYKWVQIYNPANQTSYDQMASWYDYTNDEWQVFWIDGNAGDIRLSYYGATAGFNRIAVAELPAAKGAVCVHANRMFAACSSASGNLAFSKLKDPTEWTSPDGGIIPIGSGETVIALYSLPDRMFIGTTNGVYALFGQDEDNFTVQTVSTTVYPNAPGELFASALSCHNNDSVYFSDMYDIYEYKDGAINKITRDSGRNGVTGGFAEDSVEFNSMACDGKRLYVSTNSINTDNTYDLYVFDLNKRVWHIERGFYASFSAMGRNESNRIIAADHYRSGSTFYKYPRLIALDSTNDYDNVNQFNVISDVASDWTAVHGVFGAGKDVTGNGSADHIEAYTNSYLTCVSGHDVYVSVRFLMNTALATELRVYLEGSTGGSTLVASKVGGIAAGTTYTLAGWATLGAGHTGFLRLHIYSYFPDAATQNGKIMTFSNPFVDDIYFSYGSGFLPTHAEYEADFPATPLYLNPTTLFHYHPQFSYTSPAFQIRPDAKKTLKYIVMSADLTDSVTCSVSASPDLDSTSFTTVYTMPSVPTSPGVVKIKVPISTTQKSEWVRVKIDGTGQATIMNIALVWRVVEGRN